LKIEARHMRSYVQIRYLGIYRISTHYRYSLLFKMLDDRGTSYGLEDTSLEEIFLNVAEHSQEEPSEEKSTCKLFSECYDVKGHVCFMCFVILRVHHFMVLLDLFISCVILLDEKSGKYF